MSLDCNEITLPCAAAAAAVLDLVSSAYSLSLMYFYFYRNFMLARMFSCVATIVLLRVLVFSQVRRGVKKRNWFLGS